MNLLIDMDGVTSDFNSSMARLLKQINPMVKVDFTADDFPSCWEWPTHYGYSAADEQQAWTEIIHGGLFWRSLFPYATGNSDLIYLNSLQKKHDIYFVTSRPGVTAKWQSEEWLRAHGVANPTVVVTPKHASKKLIVQAVDIKLVVEDKPETLLDLPLGVVTVLMKRPYNKAYWGTFERSVNSVKEGLEGLV